ncbi:unnamed protein product [Bursaphelenchus okinawaensis]|uniref:Uncharacterized protein n=1 Tax=Bursaphelenchus okinawaensis TaxID=465554 RepID=A0A811LQ14_9BILA|nr:unnamed protein product [Bursaphelenchus okinawaensis]CAG9127812.1 unnamed protein product [Bursaphelenchus okinawaensis]
MNYLQVLTIVSLSTAIYASECYHAFAERSNQEVCKTSDDCSDSSSDCIFSVSTGKHICCGVKEGATLPSCPSGKQLFQNGRGPASTIICAAPDEEDRCPDGFACAESTTDFEKINGQSNYVCCSE